LVFIKFCSEDGVSDQEKEHISRTLAEEIPLLIRPTEPESYYRIKTGKPERLLWMRANGNIGKYLVCGLSI
jgi:hypothetical protein